MTTSSPSYRIGIDARMLHSSHGGIGRYTRNLLERLADLDHHNQYFVFITAEDETEWPLSQPNFQPVVVDAPFYSYAEQTTFLRTLYQYRLDLVHFLNFNHPVLYRRPFVVTMHDLTVYFYPVGRSQKSRLRRAGFVWSLRHAARSAKKVIAISDHTAQDVERHLGASQAKIEIVYEGGPEPMELPFGNKAMVQEYLGIREPYFLFLSQWRPHKGMLTLMNAFAKFKAETGLPHKLVLAGKQKMLVNEVKHTLAASPVSSDILTPGMVPEALLGPLYRNATAFVMPSEYEGFGLPVLEAFAYGAPVIVAENSSLPEVAGNGGLYFPTSDVAALSERMKELVGTPGLAEELVKHGQAQLKKFSWERMAKQTHDIYLNILEK